MYQLRSEDNTSSRSMQGKRKLANKSACLFDMRESLPRFFNVFERAKEAHNERISLFPPYARGNNLSPNIFQACFTEELMKEFPQNTQLGSYKRLIFRKDGYIVLFKKLNGKRKPLNIKTKNVQQISNQKLVANLFADSGYDEEPILIFGYQKSKIGEIINPQLVYIDEGEVSFYVSEGDIFAIPVLNNTNNLTNESGDSEDKQIVNL